MEKNLRIELMAAIEVECTNVGFKKRTNNYFTRKLTTDTLGLIAFNFVKDGNMVVVPSVAVRHQPLERLIAELKGEKFHPYLGGTLASPLGHVPPLNKLLWFQFPIDIDPNQRVQELVAVIRDVALPWMERHRNLESFIDDLKDYSFADRDQMRVRRPAAYYLNNQHDIARSYLMEGLEEIGDRSGPVSNQYRHFAEALLARIAAGAQVSS
jgi:hypothetical protein